jgi:uncharacterized damage-inducible protein DinB
MTHKEDWLEKRFDFDFPVNRYKEFLQFLKDTPEKLRTLVKDVPRETLVCREGASWSIQENVGHYLTVEALFLGRLDDYEKGASILRPARFEDNPTDKAKFNERDIQWILDEFRAQRDIYINRLEALHPEAFGAAIQHPRLQVPMRLCDMLYFHVEHDRHHLRRIAELKALWGLG